MSELYIWKFIIGRKWVEADDGLDFNCCLAIVVEETEEAARARAVEFANLQGIDPRWLAKAQVHKLPYQKGAVLGWYQ